jgi:hypothetical protein
LEEEKATKAEEDLEKERSAHQYSLTGASASQSMILPKYQRLEDLVGDLQASLFGRVCDQQKLFDIQMHLNDLNIIGGARQSL